MCYTYMNKTCMDYDGLKSSKADQDTLRPGDQNQVDIHIYIGMQANEIGYLCFTAYQSIWVI